MSFEKNNLKFRKETLLMNLDSERREIYYVLYTLHGITKL